MIVFDVLTKMGKSTANFLRKNDTTLMTVGVGLGIGATAYLSGKATIKAYKIIEEAEYTEKEPLTNVDKLKRTWKFFVPPFASAVATFSLALGAQTLNLRRQAELMSTVVALQNMRKEFVEKTEELVGKSKTEKIREEVTKDKVKQNPPTDDNIIYTSHGDTLCFEEWGKTYFKHDIAQIKDAFNKLNNRINNGHRVSIADIYYELDIPQKYWPAKASQWIWSSETTGIIEPRYTSGLTDQEIPYFAIGYWEHNEPTFIY